MLNHFENQIVSKLLDGNHRVLQTLRQQLKCLKNIHREHTGAGYYVEFDIQECPQILHKANFEIDDVFIRLQGQDEDAGCVLFIREGLLSFLEIYLYLDDFPESPEILFLYYKPAPRDLKKFDAFL